MKDYFLNKKKNNIKLLIPVMLIVAIMAALLINDLVRIKKDQLHNSLSGEAGVIENILLEKFNSTAAVIEMMGKDIAKKPHDKFHIKQILHKYKSDTSLGQIFSWTIFSWADQNSQLTVDGEYGIMKDPIDLSIRDYVPKSILKPGQMFLGKPVYGSTSKKWMIPGGISIIDSNKQLLGTITVGFEISGLVKTLREARRNENITIELIFNNEIPIFNISKSSVKIFSQEEILSNLNVGKEVLNSSITLNKKLPNYPYHLILKYDERSVSTLLWEVIYSRLIEILTIIFLSFALIIIIYKREKITSRAQREVIINKSKSEFMLRIGHELKNFVAAIIGLSDIIKENLQNKESLIAKETKEAIEHLEHIDDISQELMSFVADLIDLNQSEDGKFEINRSSALTDFQDMVERSIRILRSKIKNRGIKIDASFDENLRQIANLDQRRIKQILVSIIGNAVGHSVNNSKIKVLVQNLDQNKVKITIRDCGSGMDKATIKKALGDYNFDSYDKSEKTNSIELKLTIVRFLIEKQNGNLEIESAKNYGTEVRIIF